MGEQEVAYSRRGFLKGATATLGIAAVSAMAGCAPQKNSGLAQTGDDRTWDEECDVVVVGSGTGIVGALKSQIEGMETILIDKADMIGGTTIISHGYCWMPNNGLEGSENDSRELSWTYLDLIREDSPIEDAILDAYVDSSQEVIGFIQENTPLVGKNLIGDYSDFHENWTGGLPYGRCMYFTTDKDAENLSNPSKINVLPGEELINECASAFEAAGGRIMVKTQAIHLITRGEGASAPEVIGVQVRQNGSTKNIKARRGVLLSAGGFEHNEEMRKAFFRGPSPYSGSPWDNTGDGQIMAMEVGAGLRLMSENWGAWFYDAPNAALYEQGVVGKNTRDQHKAGTIVVNREGNRFCNESGDYDTQWRSNFTWRNWGNENEYGYANIPAWIIADNAMMENIGFDYDRTGSKPGEVPDFMTVADTIEELAEKLGIDPAGLAATVERFNGFVDNLKDEDFHRGETWLDRRLGTDSTANDASATLGYIKEPPFYGAMLMPGDIGTCGGARINENSQVIHAATEEPIGRLYASGNCAGLGAPGPGYTGSGSTLGPGITFAYLAAAHMSQLSNWE